VEEKTKRETKGETNEKTKKSATRIGGNWQTARVRKVLLIVIVVGALVGATLWWVGRATVPTASDTVGTSDGGNGSSDGGSSNSNSSSDGGNGSRSGGGSSGTPQTATSEADEPSIPSAASKATIEFVVDGDTVFLDDGRKVRLLGIDTPEVGDNLECYGDEATALLRQLLPEGTPVWVLADIDPRDRFGRSLLFIYTDAATNVNLELVRQGAAEVVQYDPNFLLQDSLRAAERQAQSVGAGRWGSC